MKTKLNSIAKLEHMSKEISNIVSDINSELGNTEAIQGDYRMFMENERLELIEKRNKYNKLIQNFNEEIMNMEKERFTPKQRLGILLKKFKLEYTKCDGCYQIGEHNLKIDEIGWLEIQTTDKVFMFEKWDDEVLMRSHLQRVGLIY